MGVQACMPTKDQPALQKPHGIALLPDIHSGNAALDVLAARQSTARRIIYTKVHVTSLPRTQERRH